MSLAGASTVGMGPSSTRVVNPREAAVLALRESRRRPMRAAKDSGPSVAMASWVGYGGNVLRCYLWGFAQCNICVDGGKPCGAKT